MTGLQKIKGFRSRPINALIDRVREDTPVAGRGVEVSQSGPSGSVISAAGAADARMPLPFEVRWTRKVQSPGDGQGGGQSGGQGGSRYHWTMLVFLGKVRVGGRLCEFDGGLEENLPEDPRSHLKKFEVVPEGQAEETEVVVVVDPFGLTYRLAASRVPDEDLEGTGEVQVSIADYDNENHTLEQIHVGDILIDGIETTACWCRVLTSDISPCYRVRRVGGETAMCAIPVWNQKLRVNAGTMILAFFADVPTLAGEDDGGEEEEEGGE